MPFLPPPPPPKAKWASRLLPDLLMAAWAVMVAAHRTGCRSAQGYGPREPDRLLPGDGAAAVQGMGRGVPSLRATSASGAHSVGSAPRLCQWPALVSICWLLIGFRQQHANRPFLCSSCPGGGQLGCIHIC